VQGAIAMGTKSNVDDESANWDGEYSFPLQSWNGEYS